MRQLVQATVLAVNDDVFVYPCCVQCYSKLSCDNYSWFTCTKCARSCRDGEFNYRFRLNVQVLQGYKKCNVVAFGKCLQEIFGTSAYDFQRYLSSLPHVNHAQLVHSAVHSCIVGLPFLFAVEMRPNADGFLGNVERLGMETLLAYQVKSAMPVGTSISVIDVVRAMMDSGGSPVKESKDQSLNYHSFTFAKEGLSSFTVSQNQASFALSCEARPSSQDSKHLEEASSIDSQSYRDVATVSCSFAKTIGHESTPRFDLGEEHDEDRLLSREPAADVSTEIDHTQSVDTTISETSVISTRTHDSLLVHQKIPVCDTGCDNSNITIDRCNISDSDHKLSKESSEHAKSYDKNLALHSVALACEPAVEECSYLHEQKKFNPDTSEVLWDSISASQFISCSDTDTLPCGKSNNNGDRCSDTATPLHCGSDFVNDRELKQSVECLAGLNSTWENLPDSEDLDSFIMKMDANQNGHNLAETTTSLSSGLDSVDCLKKKHLVQHLSSQNWENLPDSEDMDLFILKMDANQSGLQLPDNATPSYSCLDSDERHELKPSVQLSRTANSTWENLPDSEDLDAFILKLDVNQSVVKHHGVVEGSETETYSKCSINVASNLEKDQKPGSPPDVRSCLKRCNEVGKILLHRPNGLYSSSKETYSRYNSAKKIDNVSEVNNRNVCNTLGSPYREGDLHNNLLHQSMGGNHVELPSNKTWEVNRTTGSPKEIVASQVDMFSESSFEGYNDVKLKSIDHTENYSDRSRASCFSEDMFDDSKDVSLEFSGGGDNSEIPAHNGNSRGLPNDNTGDVSICSIEGTTVDTAFGSKHFLDRTDNSEESACAKKRKNVTSDSYSILIPDSQDMIAEKENLNHVQTSCLRRRKSVRFNKRLSCEVAIQQLDVQLKYNEPPSFEHALPKPCLKKQLGNSKCILEPINEISSGLNSQLTDSFHSPFCKNASSRKSLETFDYSKSVSDMFSKTDCGTPNLFSQTNSRSRFESSSEFRHLDLCSGENSRKSGNDSPKLFVPYQDADPVGVTSRTLNHSTPCVGRALGWNSGDSGGGSSELCDGSVVKRMCDSILGSQDMFTPSPIPRTGHNQTPNLFEDSDVVSDNDEICKKLF